MKDLLERLSTKFTVGDDCWEWTGGKSGRYGRIMKGDRIELAHRVVYELLAGPIPDGLELDHLCRNTLCVKPSHLEPVTKAENIRRSEAPTARNARKTHCRNGHPLTEDNLVELKDYSWRRCKICHAERERWYRGRS